MLTKIKKYDDGMLVHIGIWPGSTFINLVLRDMKKQSTIQPADYLKIQNKIAFDDILVNIFERMNYANQH